MKVKIYRNGSMGWYPDVHTITINKDSILIRNNNSGASEIITTKKTKLKIKL